MILRGTRLIEQIKFELEDSKQFNTIINNEETQSSSAIKNIYIYVIEDIVSQKKYVGISMDPLGRIASHFSGYGNTELFKEITDRRSDFEYRVLESFIDNEFSPSNTNSLAYHVEALMIAFYDSIRSGYNTKFYIKSDFTDESFWLSILPDNFKKFYINSDKKQLNKNIESSLPKKYHLKINCNNNESAFYDVRLKIIYRKKLKELLDKKILVYILAKDLCNIHRSQINRFMRGMNGALKINRIAELIEKIEEYLDIAHRFDIKKELEDFINSETEG